MGDCKKEEAKKQRWRNGGKKEKVPSVEETELWVNVRSGQAKDNSQGKYCEKQKTPTELCGEESSRAILKQRGKLNQMVVGKKKSLRQGDIIHNRKGNIGRGGSRSKRGWNHQNGLKLWDGYRGRGYEETGGTGKTSSTRCTPCLS